MEVQRGYKFRAYPNKEQKQKLECEFGAVRFVYNYFLALRRNYYKKYGKGLSYEDSAKLLTQLKSESGYEWLQLSNAQSLQQTLMNLHRAYVNFFERLSGYPHFKSKRGHQSFRVPQGFRIAGNTVILRKLGPLKFKLHRPIEGKPKFVTVSRTPSGKYYVSFNVVVQIDKPELRAGNDIGVDLGLSSFLVTSDGNKVDHPHFLRKSHQKLQRLKRKHSRCQKGSKNREKMRLKLAYQEERVANQRRDFLHKQSHKLIVENQAISVETLAVKNLMANHKLARAIADSGWSEFLRQLHYKARWQGRIIRKVDRWFPSSQLCHLCGCRHVELGLDDRMWVCPYCQVVLDRDINAAINIRTAGRAGTHASGDHVRPRKSGQRSVKEETERLVPSVAHNKDSTFEQSPVQET